MKVSDITTLIILSIIMQFIFIYNYANMTNKKSKIDKKYVLIVFITSLLIYINNYFNLLFFRFFVGILINAITALLVYKDKWINTIYYSTIHAIIGIITELIYSPILMFKFDNVEIFNNVIYFKVVFSLLIGITSLLIFKSNKINSFINKIYSIIYKTNATLVLIIILIFMDSVLFFRVANLKDIEILILTFLSIIFMLISLRIIINDKYNIKLVKERNNNLKESYKAYSKTIEDCKEFKHNLKNELYGIKSFLSKEGQEQLNNIIQKYYTNYEWINKIDEIPEGLQGLIYLKQKEAQIKKIKVIINTNKILKTKSEDYLDLCNIIGILLDNAIEASINAKSKIIELIINDKKKELNIRIINKHINKIDLMKIGKKNYSTKQYKSGLGLNYINKINNRKVKVEYKIINNLFITDIKYK